MEGVSGDADPEVSDSGGDETPKSDQVGNDVKVNLKFPNSEEVRSYESSFEPSHAEVRHKGFTGSLVIRSDSSTGGVVVYLDGWPVYAYYTSGDEERYGDQALSRVLEISGSIDRHISTKDEVEMFRTYVGFLGEEEGLLNVAEVRRVEVIDRTIMVTSGGKLNKIDVPAGKRVGYAPNDKYASRYFEKNRETGYALSNNAVVFFEDGKEVERNEFKSDKGSILVRMDSEKGLDKFECLYVDVYAEHNTSAVEHVDVEFDIRGWEVVECDEIDIGEDDGGLISRFLG